MIDPYTQLLRPLLFRGDPELVHALSLGLAARISSSGLLLEQVRKLYKLPPTERMEQNLWGLPFSHPLGLAAGFDKNGQGIPLWAALGLAFVEIGTVTAQPQPGNPRPRLFRLPRDQAILNSLGFNNWGAQVVAEHLRHQPRSIPLGINLGKSKVTPLEQAAADYLHSWQQLYPWGDYFVINVSSPNTVGLRQLQEKQHLQTLVTALQSHNPQNKPILVKIAPDLSWQQLDQILEVVQDNHLAGIIATNTTLSRDHLTTPGFTHIPGGISGQPLRQRSTQIIRYLYQHSQGQIPIIGVGGINSAQAAWEKLAAGASLLQLYTGLVYHGPALIPRLLHTLHHALHHAQIPHLKYLIGSGIPYETAGESAAIAR
ncbi:MAG: quinone-dependent dihydroorotate dehydrogenase [Thermostichales cyanobacterium BF4_bins_65]